MMHTEHPDVHDVGLQDGCPRCEEHAENPFRDLDDDMLAKLLSLAVDRDRLNNGRSETELVAAKHILDTLEHVGRLCEVGASSVFEYLERLFATEVIGGSDTAAVRAELAVGHSCPRLHVNPLKGEAVATIASDPLATEDVPTSEEDRYAIYVVECISRHVATRRRVYETSLTGIGRGLEMLYEEDEVPRGWRVGVFDRQNRFWLVNPFA